MKKSGKYRDYWFNIKRLYCWLCCNCNIKSKTWFALLNYLKTDLKPQGEKFLRVDEDDWTIIDLGDILFI